MQEDTKLCTNCNTNQSMDCFSNDKYKKDGKTSKCKTCFSKYNVWSDMISRCYKPHNEHYVNYGGRGITVCKEWHTYSGMCDWIEQHWVKGLQIDRADNNKGYSESNCKFVTSTVNQLNKRKYKGSSEHRGVTWNKANSKWHAKVNINGKTKHIGCYTSELLAAQCYDAHVILNRLPNQLNF